MKKFGAIAATFAAALATFAVSTPAADAATYPNSIPTGCQFGPNRYYLLAGQNAYVLGTVTVPGNASPQGVVSAIWNGNTGGSYGANKYKTGDRVSVGPVTPRRGTYTVSVYYNPTRGSVYSSCNMALQQVVTRSRKLALSSN